MEIARQVLGYDEHDTTPDAEIEQLPKAQVVNMYLEWNGIIGYTEDILDVIEEVYGIVLDNEEY